MNTTKLELTITLTELTKLNSLKELIQASVFTSTGFILFTGIVWYTGNLIR